MRVAPISLFFSKNFDQLVEMAKKSAEVTHTHRYGMDGAVVQAVAIFQCLETSSSTMDVKDFIVKLIEKVSAVESKSDEMFVFCEIMLQQFIFLFVTFFFENHFILHSLYMLCTNEQLLKL